LYVIDPFVAYDDRGYLIKDYSTEVFESQNLPYELKEVFYTNSHKGVIRSTHFQRTVQMPKLVRCVAGKVWDVVVDLRGGSQTFAKWIAFELSGDNKCELLIPGGCGHGYLVIEDSIVSYKVASAFYGEGDDGICWNDSDVGIAWPLELVGGIENVILSEKDRNLQSLNEFLHTYGGLE
jgi:dTDP-4-dehydrorhamnose 3,5-epimerase